MRRKVAYSRYLAPGVFLRRKPSPLIHGHDAFRALPIDEYKAKSVQAAAIMLMICNNLDPQVAQFPEELVTYGGNGQVFSNWAQVSKISENIVRDVRSCDLRQNDNTDYKVAWSLFIAR